MYYIYYILIICNFFKDIFLNKNETNNLINTEEELRFRNYNDYIQGIYLFTYTV